VNSVLPFSETPHGKLTPLAQDIHAAVWDRVGLAKVQGFVREWASAWVAQDNAIRTTAHEEARTTEQVLEHWSESLEITQEQCLDRLPEFLQETFWEPEPPELPLPPSHRARSLPEKWASLAAVHDVFDMTGDKVLPWPLPADEKDLLAFAEWMGGEGGAFWGLMRAARELTDTEAEGVCRSLDDVMQAHGTRDEPPAEEALTAPPPLPLPMLTSWREILVALGLKNNHEDQGKVSRLNKQYAGPICIPGRGAQPVVDKAKLIEWWNDLEAKVRGARDRSRDAKATAAAQHGYGRDGVVAPDLAGEVKRRRKDRKP